MRKKCKVSQLVILRRLFDERHISKTLFQKHFQKQLEEFQLQQNSKIKASRNSTGGPSTERLKRANIGDLFIKGLVVSTLERKTLSTESFKLLEVKSTKVLSLTLNLNFRDIFFEECFIYRY